MMFMVLKGLVYSQDLPPEMAMPTIENKVLIDVLIETSLFKTYFVSYASDRIDYFGWKKKWSSKQISEKKKQISFEKFLEDGTIYNAFAEFTKKDLEELIEFSRKFNEGLKEPKILLTIPMIEFNMNIYIDQEYLK